MADRVCKSNGISIGFFKWRFRIWKNGFEYGTDIGGRVRFFPWYKPNKP